MIPLRTAGLAVGLLLPGLAGAADIDFSKAIIGQAPAGFDFALTGRCQPARWAMIDDPTADQGRAFAQLSDANRDECYPLAIYTATTASNIEVSVHFKPIAGTEDQAAGLAFRLQDTDNYYLVRANALEDNVRLYHVIKGERTQIANADIKVRFGIWQSLVARMVDDHIEIAFNGAKIIDKQDRTFSHSGRIALWTKADSVTGFSNLSVRVIATDHGDKGAPK